jgi:hypothetical protein
MFATQMPTKTVRRKRRSQHGKGIGKDIMNTLKKVHNFAKKTGLVSKVAGALGAAGVPNAGNVAVYAKQAGYGKVRKIRTG